MSVYALLVGIDAYQDPITPLRGAVNDVRSALESLRLLVPPKELHELVLTDGQATRAAIIDAFRGHLAAAGPGDAAVFWFSGHGSQTPVPIRFAPTEPSGFMQTLVCADSRRGRTPDLFDKELSILISEVIARGAHLTAVLDCCHSDGATREAPHPDLLKPGAASLGIRWTEPARTLPTADLLLPELADYRPPTAEHVSLAACHSIEVAHEVPYAGRHRGVFSLMLLKHLTQPGLSYRELLARTRCLVENEVPSQHPVLRPSVGPLAEQPFLGGWTAWPKRTGITMRPARGAWQIDAGACHGIVAGAPDEGPTLLGVHDDPLRRQVRIVRVLPDHSVVEPLGWQPRAGKHYPVVLTQTPLPRTTVAIADDVGHLVTEALHRAGPGGTPSPHLRLVDLADPGALADLRITFPRPGHALIGGSDRTALDAPQPCSDPKQAADVVARMEHIARWRQIRILQNPRSRLNGTIAIDVVEARPDEIQDSLRHPPTLPDEGGVVHLAYRREVAGPWVPPRVFLRLRNTADRPLYCVVLDLTDRFRMHPCLFPGAWVAPGVACVADGELIEMSLPPDREPVPGARGTDWLKVLVSETPIDSALFLLPRLGEPEDGRRIPRGFGGVVDRLGFSALYRDLAPVPRALEWATSVTTVVTSVPHPR